MSFEMLSRGAQSAVLVDRGRAETDLISRNAKELGLLDQVAVIGTDLLSRPEEAALKIRRSMERDPRRTLPVPPFDLVFADPPYRHAAELPALVSHLMAENLFSPTTWYVLEHDRNHTVTPPEGLATVASYRYGDTCLTVLGHNGPSE